MVLTAKERLAIAGDYAKSAKEGTIFSEKDMEVIRERNCDSALRWALGQQGYCLARIVSGGWQIERQAAGEEATAVACERCKQNAFECWCEA